MINKQDYINSITQNIEMVRGDTLQFNFMISGLASGDNPSFAFRITREYNKGAVVEVNATLAETTTEGKIYTVDVQPALTSNLETGLYYYDLVMTLNGTYTLMRGTCTLLYEVERG